MARNDISIIEAYTAITGGGHGWGGIYRGPRIVTMERPGRKV